MNAHPNPKQLSEFVSGKLDDQDSIEIESHLGNCSECAQVLEKLPADDTLVSLLRSAETVKTLTPQGTSSTIPMGKPSLPTLEIPKELIDHPRYQILDVIGEGGMGVVYKAYHRVMDRMVALKTIHSSIIENSDAIHRFNLNVRAPAKLSHPNIVPVFDAEQSGNLHFLVMELVEGKDLAQRVADQGPFSIPEACQAIRQAALGLQHAHEKGIVHRDIKPHNLIQTPQKEVKILDFGLARILQESSKAGRTQSGTIMGTPDYMAPEQGIDTRSADIRADIYSLGCTLYFLLIGQPPYRGVSAIDLILRHQQEPIPQVRNLRPEVPEELDKIISKMMAKKPEDRFRTPEEVARALIPFLGESKEESPISKPLPKHAQPPRFSRWGLLLGGLAATILVVVIVIQSKNGTTKIDTDDKNAKVFVDGKQVYPSTEPSNEKKKTEVKVPTGIGTWELQESGVKERLTDIAFVDAKTGIAVGYNNTIIKTTDSGKTWRRVWERKEEERSIDFGKAFFPNANEAWALSNLLNGFLHSNDGGETWESVKFPEPQLRGVGSAHISLVGSTLYLQIVGHLLKTSDGGKTWEKITSKFPGASLDGAGLCFIDSNYGWYSRMSGVPGKCSLARTEDGGKTWEIVYPADKFIGGNYVQTTFVNKNRGWLLPHFGTIHLSEDGGKTWTPQPMGHKSTSDLLKMHFFNDQVGYVLIGAYPGEVRRTLDGGKTWQSLGELRNPDHLSAFSFPTPQDGWVVGERGYIEHYHEATSK